MDVRILFTGDSKPGEEFPLRDVTEPPRASDLDAPPNFLRSHFQDLAKFGEGAVLPKRFGCRIVDLSLPYDVELVVEIRHDEPVCAAIHAIGRSDGSPVTGTGLRQLPVAALVRAACTTVAQNLHVFRPGLAPLVLTELDQPALEATLREVSRTRGYHVMDHDFLRQVAAVWHGAAPRVRTKAIADEWGVDRRTARKWVRAAKDATLIPEESS